MSQIFAALNVGDTLEMCGPFGDVTVEESEESSITVRYCGEVVLPSTRVVHMIAAGSGITPMLQLLNAMISSFSSTSLPEVTLVYANKKYSDICFRTHLQALQSKWPTKFEVRRDTVVGCWLLVVVSELIFYLPPPPPPPPLFFF
jgi:ferredoxin-NADP reductase